MYVVAFFAGMVAPYVAWWAAGWAHDRVYLPLVREPANRRFWRKLGEEEWLARERGDCMCPSPFPNGYHLPSCPKRPCVTPSPNERQPK